MNLRHANSSRIAAVLFVLVCVACAADKVDRIGSPPSDIPDTLRQAVEAQGYRVALDKGVTADFWFAKKLASTKTEAAGALYPGLSDSEFVGIVKFAQAFTDFRGQSVPSGVYTLRYQLLPQDGNHLGVAPNPDFLLAVPIASDTKPGQTYPYKKLIALSAKSTDSSHPAVIAMEAAGEPGTVTKADNGTIFSVAIPTATGTQRIGICLACCASQ